MSIFLVHAAETALGPWGLVAGLGLGAVVLARKRRGSAGHVPGADRVQEWVARVPGATAVGTAAAHVSEWWSDLYAEARHEWETGRPDSDETVQRPARRGRARRARRPRGSDGRFLTAPE
jgi:hypothetical protein